MGEYAHYAMREEIMERHGFDIGDFDDDEPKRSHKKPVYKRVKYPHCDKHPKECGLADHIRDVHRISKVKQAINSQGIPTPSNLTSKDDL